MFKFISISIFILAPLLMLSQIWQIGATTGFTKSKLIVPIQRIDRFNGVNEWNFGIAADYLFRQKISLNFSLNYVDTKFSSETEDLNPLLLFDPDIDIKYRIGYISPGIKLNYYNKSAIDGVFIGFSMFRYLFQTVNYNGFTPKFGDQANYYGMLSFGYYIFLFGDQFKVEAALNRTITRFGLTPINVPALKFRHKYWKYGIKLGVTYNFLSTRKVQRDKTLE